MDEILFCHLSAVPITIYHIGNSYIWIPIRGRQSKRVLVLLTSRSNTLLLVDGWLSGSVASRPLEELTEARRVLFFRKRRVRIRNAIDSLGGQVGWIKEHFIEAEHRDWRRITLQVSLYPATVAPEKGNPLLARTAGFIG
ncbi:hypothetical protein AVEN_177476-1 [Araneus ventricosus]|uniref:Uncharacterized protein n=1 Tax=Araneus ventricosus TaxID=182803 RepID=A0A4Y2LSQ1_ARAVE|nr:hypothetical protein AVEN_177476-1 [Araneus ventricosus]